MSDEAETGSAEVQPVEEYSDEWRSQSGLSGSGGFLEKLLYSSCLKKPMCESTAPCCCFFLCPFVLGHVNRTIGGTTPTSLGDSAFDLVSSERGLVMSNLGGSLQSYTWGGLANTGGSYYW